MIGSVLKHLLNLRNIRCKTVYTLEKGSDNCKIKRWEILKRKLNNLHPTDVQRFFAAHPACTVIDCRRAEEFEMVRLPQAINIDYLAYDFWDKIKQLPTDKVYFVYCNTCRRSTRVCTLMQNGGFSAVYNLKGGLKEWVATLGDEGVITAFFYVPKTGSLL